MNLDAATIDAIAEAVAERLQRHELPPGWPVGRGCISEPEAATFLGIGQDFLRELRLSGRVACTMQGRRVTFSPVNIAEYLTKCRCHGSEGAA